MIIEEIEINPTNFHSFSEVNEIEKYYYIKSHRSNVTEGNTTNVGEFTELVKEQLNKSEDYTVPNKIMDETYEIVNLKKVYGFLEKIDITYDTNQLQRAHTILGNRIFKNNLVESRGRLKTQNNFVPFVFEGTRYEKYFIPPVKVKNSLDRLFLNWNKLPDNSVAAVFAKFVILQLEIIAIHPFNDGNGRISRAFSESYLENKGIVPYTPYTKKQKMDYQEAMGAFSVLSQTNIIAAYKAFTLFILNLYNENVKECINSLDKLSRVIDESE